ncbi:carboxypeptidase-like regulatory domain-containing protein [Lewinella sp. LCG006]|uniref:SprB repeat-containing protein n=1 Tax=Lewinella sp. LCG006 TaxID=3231911 RepID=UPI003460261B
MLPVNISYPFFEANQVLSNEHLNQLFNYLDEQERLTRTNLIGIGIVCGLEPSIADSGDSIQISKGCGVTSEGYLITWGTQAALEWYRPYEVPDALPYREFGSGSNPFTPFPIWELTADRNNDATAVRVSRDFLQGVNQVPGEGDEKILVLFLECEAESNRNCAPNSCNDKGSTVTATIRPLLIRKQDIDLLQARIRALGPEAEAYFSLADSMSNRLGLPTLKLPRFDVAATNLGSTTSIFSAFQLAMSQPVVEGVANALSAAHQAFAPLLTDFPANPFANLLTNWAFLYNRSIETSGQYLWYQYYYDHLDTVIQAYEEFRLRGLEVLGLCCPDSRLFKRHLFAGNLGVEPIGNSYRHSFVPSPLFTRQQGAMAELRLLFARLVSLVQELELPPNVSSLIGVNVGNIRPFTPVLQPGVFTPFDGFTLVRPELLTAFRPRLSTSIKITPSLLGGPLSRKAIPYHYRPVPLYEQWSYHLTRQGKARHNLGYRSNAWNTTDLFVRFPLQYDLEPNNFLRIEGHIGQNYVQVLSELLAQKDRNRLPIDIIALKSGFNEDNIPLPREVEDCHFQDLDTLYQAFREELLCQLCEAVKRFYLTPILPNQAPPQAFGNRVPQLPFLQQCAPNFRYFDNSIGAYYENNLSQHTATAPYLGNLESVYIYHVLFIFNLVKLAEALPENVGQLDMTVFRQRHNALMGLMQVLNNYILQITNDAITDDDNNDRLDLEEFSDQMDHVLFACKLESFQRIFDEYQDRINKIREQLLFTKFLDQHPGIQHKAGVPMGGTFVMVYHGDDQPDDVPVRQGRFTIRGRVVANGEVLIGVTIVQVGTTSGTVTDFDGNFSLVVNSLPARLEVLMAGFESREVIAVAENVILNIDLAAPVDNNTDLGRFADLAVGTVIADFYLPYLCCSDCTPVQFVLPKEPPTFSWEQVGCTTPNNTGLVLITPTGGTAPYDYSLDGGVNWQALAEDPIAVNNGAQVQIRDAEGTISVRRTIALVPQFVIDPGASICDEDGQNFQVEIFINGGRQPYRVIANGQTYEVPLGENIGFATFPSGQGGEVIVEDSSTPACEQRFDAKPVVCEQGCGLPCNGITRECGHPFWMQRNPNTSIRYQRVQLRVNTFTVIGDQPGQAVNFNTAQLGQLTEILNPSGDFSTASVFSSFWNSRMPDANEFIQSVLGDTFGSPEDAVILLTYDPTGVDNFTTLRIEHYSCHTYVIEIEVSFSGASVGKHDYRRFWQYRESGSEVREEVIINSNQTFQGEGRLPAYNCIIRDRCNPNNPPQELCTEPTSLEINFDPGGNQLFLFANNAGERPVLWMVEYAFPAILSGTQVETNLQADFNTNYVIRAIAVDPDTTCASVASASFVI